MGYASELGTFSVTIRKRFLSLVIPILICSILSGVGSLIIYGFFATESGGGPPPATPIQDDSPGSAALNALFYVGIAFIGATVIFLIFKYGKIGLLKGLFATAIAVTSFFFIFLLTIAAPYYFLELFWGLTSFSATTDWVLLSLGIVFGLAFSVLTVFSMVYQKTPQPMPQIMAMLFAVLAGTFLATFLPMLVSIFVMIGLSIYDIISVFRGPIKKIAEISEERYNNQLKEEEEEKKQEQLAEETETTTSSAAQSSSSSEDEEQQQQEGEDSSENDPPPQSRSDEDEEVLYTDYIELGLGDLAFFGMLFSFALIRLGAFAAIAGFVGVVVGAIGTIKLLERVSMMPGLPLSVGLGLILAFAVWGILALAGYDGWGWIAPDWFSTPV
ncbi:MAG: hypothetical protein GF308_04135 [Candidatus Heimdallarchaeota archaeon]|nr:hypothetical protein [Candidatus Heimdallarchaeota archaeon]